MSTDDTSLLALLRQWAVIWLMDADPSAPERIFTEDYVLHIGAHSFTNRDEYAQATLGQLHLFNGLMVTVHEVITNGHQAVLRLTEHGASTKHEGRKAAWKVIALFDGDSAGIATTWAEEDYHARKRQLIEGTPDPIEAPICSPWTTPVLPPNPGAEDLVRQWIEAGMECPPGVSIDDQDVVGDYKSPLRVTSGQVDFIMSAGQQVGFHARLRGAFADDQGIEGTIRAAGLVRVDQEQALQGHVITDRLGIRKPKPAGE